MISKDWMFALAETKMFWSQENFRLLDIAVKAF
jgi:hypothetical protein